MRGWQQRRGGDAKPVGLLTGEAAGLPDGQMTGPRRRTAQLKRDRLRGARAGAPEAVRIRMLGGFRVSVGSRTIDEYQWRRRKAAALLKLLALAPRHRLHREQAKHLLWPGLAPEAAANNLRRTLHCARRTLDPVPAGAHRHLRLSGGQLGLCPEGELWVDVEAFEEAAARARRSREPTAYEAAIGLYAGDLLPEDRYEEWADARREELRALYLAQLVELAGLHEERGEPGRAIEALRLYHERSYAVRRYVLARAGGICESCGYPAPFRRPDGSPYLEPHHTRKVSDGGPDHPRWVGALCPNCHREIHYGEDAQEKNRRLQQHLAVLEGV